MALNASSVTLRDYPTGLNIVTLDVDPYPYDPYFVPIRGSSVQVLNGQVIHQVFGLQKKDYHITLQGQMTDADTVAALWSKYRQGGGGQQFELRDWVENRFVVIFAPGSDSFHPQPLPGALNAHTFTMTFAVIDVLALFGAPY